MKESIKHELAKSDKDSKPSDKSYGDRPADAVKPGTRAVPMPIPSGGEVVAANPGYWVLTASDAADGGKPVFGRPRSVIAWIVGADTSTPPYPVTVRPFDPGIETVAMIEVDGSVIGLDNVHYGSQQDWQTAVIAAAGQ